MIRFCGACGMHARHDRSPEKDLRGRDCPRFGTVHRGCCSSEACSSVDTRGHVRCDWARGGKERVMRPSEARDPAPSRAST